MRWNQKIEDLPERKLFLILEKKVPELKDAILRFECSICYTEKENEPERCILCGSLNTLMTVF